MTLCGAGLVLVLVAFLLPACSGSPEESAFSIGDVGPGNGIDPPAVEGALAPNLALVSGAVAASWLEPFDEASAVGHRLQFSRFSGGDWSAPATVAEGGDFFANWADLPAVVETGNGDLLAHWLAKTGADTYAYSIFLARSQDGGSTWTAIGKLNSDDTDTEHGFVSWVEEGDGARAFWLDGREMATGGAMSVRSALIGGSVGVEDLLDGRACECCSTDAAVSSGGPLLVYRDRSDDEIRDVMVVRREAGGWSDPAAVSVDAWRIDGCPVNGPAVAAAGARVAVAWYTAAGSGPRVQLAFSDDGGASFGTGLVLDAEAALGRVDLALDSDGSAWVTWLHAEGGEAEVALQRVDSGGEIGERLLIGTTSISRASGFPRLLLTGDALYVAWVEVAEGQPQRIRVEELSLSGLEG